MGAGCAAMTRSAPPSPLRGSSGVLDPDDWSSAPGAPASSSTTKFPHQFNPGSMTEEERAALEKKFLIPRSRATGPTPILTDLGPTDAEAELAAQAARRRKIFLRESEMLRCACQEGNESEVVRLLKRHEHDEPDSAANDGDLECFVNLADSTGNTALTNACTFGNLQCVQMLLDAPGIDAAYCNRDGKTALHRAAYNGHVSLLAPLAAAGCDLDHADKKGNTAMHYAASNGFQNCALELLRLGASCQTENYDGQTVFNLAKKRSLTGLAEELRARGAPLGSSSSPNKMNRSSSVSSPESLKAPPPGERTRRSASVDDTQLSLAAVRPPPSPPIAVAVAAVVAPQGLEQPVSVGGEVVDTHSLALPDIPVSSPPP